MDFNILSCLIWIPVIGAFLITLVPKNRSNFIKWIAAFFTGVQLFLAFILWFNFDNNTQGFQFMEKTPWIPSFNITYMLGVDGLSLPMVGLTALLSFLCIFVSWKIDKAPKGYFSLFLLLDAGMMGVFLSLDFFLFYIFWEVMLLPMYFLIGIWGGPNREYAAIKFFLYTLFGSVLMLIAILALYFSSGKTFDMIELMSTAPTTLGQISWWGFSGIKVVWLLLFIGFAIKVPIFPFHTWLPLAHVEAPTAVSVILAGVLLKMGTYGLLRINFSMIPDGTVWFAGILAFLALINIIWGGLCALAQTDLKKMVAYSSISHMGYVMLGMSAVVSAGSKHGSNIIAAELGMNGAVLQMFNHGTITAMLFILVGVVYDRAHHRDINGFGGLASKTPIYAAIVALAWFAGLGLPGLSGFISEAMTFLGAFPVHRNIVILSTIGILLNAAYFLRSYQKIFLGKLNEKYKDLPEINNREIMILIPLAFLVIFLGVYPTPLIDIMKTTMSEIIFRVEMSELLTK